MPTQERIFIGDSKYTSYNGLNYDLDVYSYYANEHKGEGCEAAISNLLFKMSDSDKTTDLFDTISIDVRSMFSSVKNIKPSILSSFIFDMYSVYEGGYFTAIGKLIGKFEIAPSNIEISYGKNSSEAPTITWTRDGSGEQQFLNSVFQLSIYNKYMQPHFFKTLNTNTFTPSPDEWNILKINGMSKIDVIGSTVDYIATGPFNSDGPLINKECLSINSEDYGFPQQYNFVEQTKEISINNSSNNLSFKTERLRAGFIQNECIVLSSRQKDAGVAYLSFSTGFAISRINIELSLWSDNEMLYPYTSTAVIQYKSPEDGIWYTQLDLLNDVVLSTNRNSINSVNIYFPDVYEIRIYLTSLQSGTNNKGRLCIGNLKMNYEL